MTPAQSEALARAAAATGPIKLPGATARILHERYGYVDAEGDGWVLSPRGLAALAAKRARECQRQVEGRLTIGDRDWAGRVEAWLIAHDRFERRGHYAAWEYARHVAACDHAGIEPVAVGSWAEGAREWVEEEVRAGAQLLREFDDAFDLATARGVGVLVTYEADEKVPRSRRDAATAAADGRQVVSLATYRERRPTPDGAA